MQTQTISAPCDLCSNPAHYGCNVCEAERKVMMAPEAAPAVTTQHHMARVLQTSARTWIGSGEDFDFTKFNQ